MNAVVVALGASAGPTLGGLITEHYRWRWIFYLNVPVGVLGLLDAAGVRQLRPARRHLSIRRGGAARRRLRALILGLSFGQEWGWTSARLLTCLALVLVSLLATARVERRVRHPIIDLACCATASLPLLC